MPGMTVSCAIIIEKLEDVIYIPLESLYKKNGRNIVYTARGRRFKARDVVIGAENNNYVVIQKGLKKGEKIALTDPASSFQEVEKELSRKKDK